MSTKFSEYMDLELETDLLRELSLTPFLPSSEVFFKSHTTNEKQNKTDTFFKPIGTFTETQTKVSMFNSLKNEETTNLSSDQQNNYGNIFFQNGSGTREREQEQEHEQEHEQEEEQNQNQNQIEMGPTLNNENNYNFPKYRNNESSFQNSHYVKFFSQEKNACETLTDRETPLKFEVQGFEDQPVFGKQKNFDFCFENMINKQNFDEFSNIDIGDLLTDNYNNLSESTIPTNTELVENNKKNLIHYYGEEEEEEEEDKYENENEDSLDYNSEDKDDNEDENKYSFSTTPRSFQQQNLSRKERRNLFKSKQNTQGTDSLKKEGFKDFKKNRKKYFKGKKGIDIEDGWGQKTYQILPGDKFGLRILKKKRRTRKKRQSITENARKILEKWFKRHSKDKNGPYPDRITRVRIGMRTDTPELQVQRWFGQRRRIEKSRWENGEIPKPCWI
ncbi:hypothetical protein M0812_29725 [Anaeramoeba flamelloides]|uniref:Homeobox domain-containing protein n=1 Tax=Anaeramoeba flamelloides TaxID=1746091 RepID=A0AAV7Y2L3_9EUKA|nr:hypothetical protein M0812_29725 [Anaeramoeba flamelloides]